MRCNKCNHDLPNDSEFCQYCGNKIESQEDHFEKATMEPDNTAMNFDAELSNASSAEEIVDVLLKLQAEQIIEAMEANHKSQPCHEGETDFGLIPEKPIYTLALMHVKGKEEYLNRLYTSGGEKITWSRRGSTTVEGINGVVDIYDTFLPSGQHYKTIYMNRYGAHASVAAPAGFILKPVSTITPPDPFPHDSALSQTRCKRCGGTVDRKTNRCMDCGKKQFKGFRWNKYSITCLVFSLVVVAFLGVTIYQYVTNVDLQERVANLNAKIDVKNSMISSLREKNEDLESENRIYSNRLSFYNKYVAVIPEGSKKYHKYGCDDLDSSAFWIYNTNAAEQRGYYACPNCH